MEVKIISDYGENVFKITDDGMLELISLAFDLAMELKENNAKMPSISAKEKIEATESCELPMLQPVKIEPKKRTESLFGNDWKGRYRESLEKKEESFTGDEERTYKGFLIVKCEHCDSTKGFCAKQPISSSKCSECGGYTDLKDMRPVRLRCKCGSEFNYRTNIKEDRFEFNCLTCGSPVDLELNAKKSVYFTV